MEVRGIAGVRRKAVRLLWCGGIACLALGCADAGQDDSAVDSSDPAAEFFSLEERLLRADRIRFDFAITAEGAVEADIQGSLEVGPGADAELVASGMFAGQPADLRLRSNQNALEFGNGTSLERTETPAYLKDALVIGVTRMGILHNLARLTGTTAPDHAEGGVSDWVTVGRFAAGADSLSFDLTVAGEPAGSAVLVVDSNRLPTLRRQTVEFPSGQMRVVERYSGFTIGD